jgi:hypothetical protein
MGLVPSSSAAFLRRWPHRAPSFRASRPRGRDGANRPPQKFCGCLHTDPGVRAAAIHNVPAKRRVEVCETARAVVRLRPGPYSMDANRAAVLLGCSVKYIEILAKGDMIRSMYKRGALWVSSKDVRRLVATQRRNKRHRQAIEQWESSLA